MDVYSRSTGDYGDDGDDDDGYDCDDNDGDDILEDGRVDVYSRSSLW